METLISVIKYLDTHHLMTLILLVILWAFIHYFPYTFAKITEIFTASFLVFYNLAKLEVTFSIIENTSFTSLVSNIFNQPYFWTNGFLSGVYFATTVPITLILLWRSVVSKIKAGATS